MSQKILVEDYGAELAEAITSLAKAVKTTPLTNRAIAVLLHDYDKSITLTDCERIVTILPKLAEYYTK
jgi:hypothetical protein